MIEVNGIGIRLVEASEVSRGREAAVSVALLWHPVVEFNPCSKYLSRSESLNHPTRSNPVKTSIAHLPEQKQEELRRIVEIVREAADVEMVILFGSYAAGTWVEEPGPDPRTFEYQSDYDVYVLTGERRTAKKGKLWAGVEQRLRREVRTPVQLLAESIGAFDSYVREGRYFYVDIRREGIVLYGTGRQVLSEPRELSGEERWARAEEEFEYWFGSACEFLIDYRAALNRGSHAKAAFELHQAVERFYSAVLLVYTNYKPKLHDIEKLGALASGHAPELLPVFPRGTSEEGRLFDLLRRAYVEARYDKGYRATREELEWLAGRVDVLRGIVENVCRRRMGEYGEGHT